MTVGSRCDGCLSMRVLATCCACIARTPAGALVLCEGGCARVTTPFLLWCRCSRWLGSCRRCNTVGVGGVVRSRVAVSCVHICVAACVWSAQKAGCYACVCAACAVASWVRGVGWCLARKTNWLQTNRLDHHVTACGGVTASGLLVEQHCQATASLTDGLPQADTPDSGESP